MIVISSIYQKFLKTSLELYRWEFDMEEIPALFVTTMLELLKLYKINLNI